MLIIDIIFIVITFYIVTKLFKSKNLKVARVIALLIPIEILLLIFNLFTSHKYLLLVLIIYIIIIIVLGKKFYLDIKIKEIKIENNKVTNKIRMLYIADFQYDKANNNFNIKAFENLISIIEEQDYDLILFGGDYYNYEKNHDQFIKHFKRLIHEYSYAVMGNHDEKWKENIINTFESLGVHSLENKAATVTIKGNKIQIIGVEDLWRANPNLELFDQNKETLNILLSHNPDFIDDITQKNIDLILSGHYHNAQVNFFPKFGLARIISKYIYGSFFVNGMQLYVTSGVGGSFMRGPLSSYIRWFSRPEIVIIEFDKSTNKK